jgi:hypothetical protein
MSAADKKPDGGPAFPEPGLSGLPNGEFLHGREGMSLRDYFAAHAPMPDQPMQLEEHCAYRYRYADQMLKARQS